MNLLGTFMVWIIAGIVIAALLSVLFSYIPDNVKEWFKNKIKEKIGGKKKNE